MNKVFSVYDSKVSAYSRPFFARSAGEALRIFEASSTNPESNISRWKGDYTLFEIGEFDDLKGIFTNHHAPMNLGTALQFDRPDPSQLTMPFVKSQAQQATAN